MSFRTFSKYALVIAVAVAAISMASVASYGQSNYVLVQATEDKVFVPYGLQEATAFVDSTMLRGPSFTLMPEFEAACNSFGAIDIDRAFQLLSAADTVRCNPAGKRISTKFMHRWYKIRIPEAVSSIDFAQYLQDSVGLWAEPRIHAEPDIVEPPDTLYHCCWYPYPQNYYWGINGDGPGWDFRMELPKAWEIHTGSSNERIAIFDTGIEETQDDLDDVDDVYSLLRLSAQDLACDPNNPCPGWDDHTGYGLPKLDSAYWFLTKPNTIQRFDVNDGWDESTEVDNMYITGVLNLQFKMYYVVRHKMERWVEYPHDYYQVYGAWVRGSSSLGASYGGPLVPATYGSVLEWNQDSCKVFTCWYEIFKFPQGQPLAGVFYIFAYDGPLYGRMRLGLIPPQAAGHPPFLVSFFS